MTKKVMTKQKGSVFHEYSYTYISGDYGGVYFHTVNYKQQEGGMTHEKKELALCIHFCK